MGLGHLRRH